jgi:hypothetical protein
MPTFRTRYHLCSTSGRNRAIRSVFKPNSGVFAAVFEVRPNSGLTPAALAQQRVEPLEQPLADPLSSSRQWNFNTVVASGTDSRARSRPRKARNA